MSLFIQTTTRTSRYNMLTRATVAPIPAVQAVKVAVAIADVVRAVQTLQGLSGTTLPMGLYGRQSVTKGKPCWYKGCDNATNLDPICDPCMSVATSL